MIQNIYVEPSSDQFSILGTRPKQEADDIEQLIKEIFAYVAVRGDKALRHYTKMYDGVTIDSLRVELSKIHNAQTQISDQLKKSIGVAKTNIERFHQAQKTSDVHVETMPGVECSQVCIGIEKVGLYIPGGTAPLFSTVLMLAIPAMIADCKEVILCTPPDKKGNIHPAILYAASLCGIDTIYKVGGAQAIAAMTIGTENISRVDKIFGPGNQFVTCAKIYAQKYGVAIDMPAGPSELLVYADRTADTSFVAADLLSQAEHGTDSQVILVATSEAVAEQVNSELEKQLIALPRIDIAKKALSNSKIVIIEDQRTAFDFINEYAPEHLIISSDECEDLLLMVRNAGSVFLGHYCPESAGDYASGTNHTLPTDGWAKSCSGVNLDSFSKKMTIQRIDQEGLQNIGGAIIDMATEEELQAHANAVQIRLLTLKGARS